MRSEQPTVPTFLAVVEYPEGAEHEELAVEAYNEEEARAKARATHPDGDVVAVLREVG